MRYIVQVRHLLLVLETVFECDFIRAGKNGGLGVVLSPIVVGTTTGSIQTCFRKFPYGILGNITEKVIIEATESLLSVSIIL